MSETTFVMTKLGQSLMTASPHGPRQAVQWSKRTYTDQIPEEPTDFRDGKRSHAWKRSGNGRASPLLRRLAGGGALRASAAIRLSRDCSTRQPPSRRAGVLWLPLPHSETATATPRVPWPADPPARAARPPPPNHDSARAM